MTQEWYVARRGQDGSKRDGPMPLSELRDKLDAGRVRPDDLVWCEGMGEWRRAEECRELFPTPAALDDDRPPRSGGRYDEPPCRRGYDRYDERPYDRYPRRRPPVQSSNSWLVPVVVIGSVVAIMVLGCGGTFMYGLMRSPAAFPAGGPGYYGPPAVVVSGPYPGLPNVVPYSIQGGGVTRLEYGFDVDRAGVQRLGVLLEEKGFLEDGALVQVRKWAGVHQIALVSPDVAFIGGEDRQAFVELRQAIADAALFPTPVEIQVYDENNKLLLAVPPNGAPQP